MCIVKRPPKPRTLQHFCYIAKHLLYTVLTPEDILYRGVCACVFMSISVCKKVRLSSQHITVTLLAYSWTGGGLGFFLDLSVGQQIGVVLELLTLDIK